MGRSVTGPCPRSTASAGPGRHAADGRWPAGLLLPERPASLWTIWRSPSASSLCHEPARLPGGSRARTRN